MEETGHSDEGLPPPAKKAKLNSYPDVSKYTSWTADEVLDFFSVRAPGIANENRQDLESLLKRLYSDVGGNRPEKVEGKNLDQLTEEKILLNAHSDEHQHAMKILHLVKSLQQQQYTIVNIPEFQRLRNIKQLVCHLAGELTRNLQQNQPELGITDQDVLCVEIAGLCHDLGHGPFSHVFERLVAKWLVDDGQWKHEPISKMMFDAIYEKKKEDFEHYGLKPSDILFIREQLEGKNHSRGDDIKGRNPEKYFLYEIVANKRNGIDVDKWDYFARDCHYLGITNNFQSRRCLELAHVAAPEENPKDLQICIRDKEVGHLYSMLNTRSTLHQRAYQHKTTRAVEHIISEAFVLVADAKLIHLPSQDADEPGKQESLSLREVVCKVKEGDMSGFVPLTDQYVGLIMCAKYAEHPPELRPKLIEAQKLLQRLENRQLYHFVWEHIKELERAGLSEEIAKCGENVLCHAEVVTMSYASEKKLDTSSQSSSEDFGNPLNDVRFYSKMDPWKAIKIDQEMVSQLMVPKVFTETQVRVYDKNFEMHDSKGLLSAFRKWVRKKPEIFGSDEVITLKTDSNQSPYVAANRLQELAPLSSPISKRKLF